MKKYKSVKKEDHVQISSPGQEAAQKLLKSMKEYHKPEKLNRKQIRRLPPGEAYITRRDKLAWKKTRKDAFINGFWNVVGWILFPFAWISRKIGRGFHNFFYMKTNFRNNGIIGPGYSSWHEEHFSWGKLSFVLIVLFIITYFIFLR